MNLNREKPLARQYHQPIHYLDRHACTSVVSAIRYYLSGAGQNDLVIVCIGTDRSTGDALGPLVGTQLESFLLPEAAIYGTLENPVHAVNLQETLSTIKVSYRRPFIIAVDACLGQQQNIGKICVSEGPVLPGAGVNKKLEPVGNINITGVVNVSGFMEYSVLQSTRLSIVINLSKVISKSLVRAILSRDHANLFSRFKSNY
ncbi:spore protease YyaC [Sporolactobacillus pectinivorans]|uniref:spore protease YyaC n=1 Tax=Sporolactobacillus pectinivorans TaxID=1591408 RepID=UPI000C265862|nr:spore protease YyaC [Sporolactobacillus pectinivorans]